MQSLQRVACLVDKHAILCIEGKGMRIATNIEGYPLKIRNQSSTSDSINTRAMTNNRPVEIGGSILTKNTCVSDAIRLWNLAPNDIKNCESLYQLKKLTRIYVKTLPV